MSKNGLTPSRLYGSGCNSAGLDEKLIESNYATAIYQGDTVVESGGYLIKGTAGDNAVGVFMGVKYTDPSSGELVFKNYYPGSIVASDIKALVVTDEDATFLIPADAAVPAGSNGKYAGLNFTAGSTVTGRSGFTLDVATIAASAGVLDVKIERVVEFNNDVDTGALVEVRLLKASDRANLLPLSGVIPDVSTASSTAYMVAPIAGTITLVQSILRGTIATADDTLTLKINGVAVTGGAITAAFSGSAAGDIDSATPTALNVVAVGDLITIESDGASTNAVAADVLVNIAPIA